MGQESFTNKKHFLKGGIIGIVGFLLSPLSWWNDILVNIPLSYLGATILSHLVPGHFSMFLIATYWFTNVLGLVLMHKGGSLILGNSDNSYNVRSVIKDLGVSFLYSLILVLLVITHVLKLPQEYFLK